MSSLKNATFETETSGWDAWDRGRLSACRGSPTGADLLEDRIVVWAALCRFRRACYAGVAEHSIYVDKDFRGQGIGKTLLLELVGQAERCGFRVRGRRKGVAKLHGVWRDTGFGAIPGWWSGVVPQRRSRR